MPCRRSTRLSYAPWGAPDTIAAAPAAPDTRSAGESGSRAKGRRRYDATMSEQPYEFGAIEEKWQRRWRDEGTYEVDNDDPRPKSYVLCMYPYPSGPAHMGHVRNYTFGDLLVRYRTM